MSERALIDELGSAAARVEALVRSTPHAEHELIMHLEPDQLVTETLRPVPRARLSRRATLGLWTLRIFCVLVSLMVLYTFVYRLR